MGITVKPVPFGGKLMTPHRPLLREALSVATGVDDETLDEMLRCETWEWLPREGLRWTCNNQPRWTGPLRGALRSPSEAWEAMAARGIIPDAWVGDRGQRSFANGSFGTWPQDLRAAVALASDPEGITQAEYYAREAVERLSAWLPGKGLRIVWRVVERYDSPYGFPAQELACPVPGGPTVITALAVLGDPVNRPRPQRRGGRLVRPARLDLSKERWFLQPWWGAKMERGAIEQVGGRLEELIAAWRAEERQLAYDDAVTIGGERVAVPAAVAGRRLAELPDFLDPIERIWSLGYGLEWVAKRSVILVAPTVG